MKAIIMSRIGGPDVIELAERPEPVLARGEVLVEIAAAGVNFMDIGVRRGLAWTEMANPKVGRQRGTARSHRRRLDAFISMANVMTPPAVSACRPEPETGDAATSS